MVVGGSPSRNPPGVGPRTFRCSSSSVPSQRIETSLSGARNRWIRSEPAAKWGFERPSVGATRVAGPPASPSGFAGTQTISVPGAPPSPCVS